MSAETREPTLPLEVVGGVHIGFRSPLPVRLRLWWRGLLGRLSSFESVRMDGLCCKGWVDDNGTTFVTRVWLSRRTFERFRPGDRVGVWFSKRGAPVSVHAAPMQDNNQQEK